MKFYSFNEFVNESMQLEFSFSDENGKQIVPKDFRKVQFIADNYDMKTEYGFKFIACHSLFKLITPDDLSTFDKNLPTVSFALNSFVQKMLDNGDMDLDKLYNTPKCKDISGTKRKFHELLANEDFLPKTVFTIESAAKLKFPIIAKPSVGHSGIGITKFETHAELKASKDKETFDLFSEAIKIDKEVRLIYLKDELISYMIREPQDDKSRFLQGKTKSMGKQNAEDKLDFKYHILLPDEMSSKPDFFFGKVEKMERVKEIVKKIRKKIPLEFLTVDLAIDDDGEMWVIEINTEPGSSGVMLANLYDAVFRDFYGRPMDKDSLRCLTDVELKLINFTMKSDKYVLSEKFVDKYIK